MKKFHLSLLILLASIGLVSIAKAQNSFSLNPAFLFGTHTDGSIRPGDSIGASPINGNDVQISAPTVNGTSYGIQPGDSPSAPVSTNGFNMRGIAYDPVSGNLVFVDTHTGSGGSQFMPNNSAIYVLNSGSGQIIGALNTNGLVNNGGGVGCVVAAGVADDGVVYVCDQINAAAASAFKIYRWATADINSPSFTNAAVVAFSNTVSPTERIGQTMDVRGAGTNTQIIVGTSSLGGTGTNIYLYTTGDGTNFTAHRIFLPGVNTASFNDGIAFGLTNTFWVKQVGKPLYFAAYDPVSYVGSIIASYTASSVNDPLLNISGIAVDVANHLLAGLEEIGGSATGGRGKVWLFDLYDPTNHAPAVLSSQTYIPNFQKTTAPMGYLDFGGGKLFAHASNNGFLVNNIASFPMGTPSFTQDLPPTTRAVTNSTVHFEVFAVVDVTNYQWFTNSIPVAGATTYFLDVPSVTTNMSGIVFTCVASNAAGATTSTASTLTVFDTSGFFHPLEIWRAVADTTNYITGGGGGGTPNERCIAFNALSNQLLVTRGVVNTTPKIFVIDADTGAFLYNLKTNGMLSSGTLSLCGIGVADDGAVDACNAAADSSFRVYCWTNSGSNTLPFVIWGTNAVRWGPGGNTGASAFNPAFDWTGSQMFRYGDNLAVRGAGTDTEIVVDAQNSTKFAGILRPTDSSMTNWGSAAYLLQNVQGSYGSEAYGTTIGRSLQFGPSSGGGNGHFWQKRHNGVPTTGNTPGAPFAEMSYTPSTFTLAGLTVANTGLPLFTNGAAAINTTLGVGAAINFVGGGVGNANGSPDNLSYYDMSDPSQAIQIDTKPLPGANSGGHKANNNAIAQIVFGQNLTTLTNYIFTINGNNGISTFVLSGGTVPPPKILTQPKNLRVLVGASGSMSLISDQIVSIIWYKGTNSPVDTGVRGNVYSITNSDTTMAGDYFAIVTNSNGSATSRVAHVTVSLPQDNYTLTPGWAAGGGNVSYPYITTTGGANTPGERSMAYNALSNQLVVIHCPPSSTAYTNYVVDGTSGALLYILNTTGIIHMGGSEVTGSNPIDEVGSAAADDGALYVASESPNASGGLNGQTDKMMHIYRWADTGPNTAPVLIFEGDPSGQAAGNNLRWGDAITARGSGTNTELFMNSQEGNYVAFLQPTNPTMTGFSNYFMGDVGGSGSIGRSLQFGPTNTVFEKRKSGPLVFSSYTNANNSEQLIFSADSSSTLGGVAVDLKHGLAIGVDFVGSATRPDAVSLYDIADPTAPLYIASYSFPSNQIANANVICQTIIAGTKVYAMDANNGIMMLTINGPKLSITKDGANVILTWGLFNGYKLQSTPSLTSPVTWTDVAPPAPINIVNGKNTVTNAVGATPLYYRLVN